jgi:peptide-methionine (R)-S-oxide reductase
MGDGVNYVHDATNRDKTMLSRRFLLGSAAVIAVGGTAHMLFRKRPAMASEVFEISHTDAEWRKLLTPEQYDVLRREGTERPYTSALNHEKRAGTFACAGCALVLFSSETKFDSHTGWPSFWQPLANAVDTRDDRTFGMLRTEVHCHRCGGHLGHVFTDGPKPTGLRYCMNGVAMTFTPAAA